MPNALLTNQLLTPWADGCDPTLPCSENGSPVWITAVCDTTVFVDFDQDGITDAVDLNGDGDTTDVNVDGKDETTSASGIPVNALERLLIHDPTDGSQTGALIYTLDALGNPPGCDIAGVWGQNSSVASPAVPAIDVGTLIPPFGADIRLEKSTNAVDADLPSEAPVVAPGDPIVWEYVVTNVGDFALTNVVITDDQLNPADLSCDASPVGDGTDLNGDNVIDRLEPGEEAICTANGIAEPGLYANIATAVGQPVTSGGNPINPPVTATDPSHYLAPDPALSIDKQPSVLVDDADSSSSVTAGDTIEWTILVSNDGNLDLTGVTVTDDQADTLACERADTSNFDHVGGDDLALGEIITCTASRLVTVADAQAGQIVNTAVADSNETPPDDDTETTPVVQPSACEKGSVAAVLDPVNGRFPGNTGPDALVQVDLGGSVQAAIDNVTLNGDLNGDGYLIVFVEHSSGVAGGQIKESIVIDATYTLPFALIGCGTTLQDAAPFDGLPTAHITASTSGPDIFVMDVYANDSEAEGWLVEGDGRVLRNIRALKNAIGIRMAGDDNLLHSGVEIGWNSVAGIQIDGDGNEIDEARTHSNGTGILIAGDGNLVRKTDVGDCNTSNLWDGIVVSGNGNTVEENDVFANYGNGILVSGTANVLRKNDVGDDGKGNVQDGILVAIGGQAQLLENRIQGNLGRGMAVDSAGNLLADNDSGGSSVQDANLSCEFEVAAGNTNGGSNRSSSATVTGDPFPTGCIGILPPPDGFTTCAGIAAAPRSGSGPGGPAPTLPLSIATSSLRAGKVAKKFNFAIKAKAGVKPCTWTAGALPPGLSFAPTTKGLITGLPEVDGFFPITAEVTDAAGTVISTTLTLQIEPNPVLIRTKRLGLGRTTRPLRRTLKARGGAKPYTWQAIGAPAWLLLDSTTGKITGTPTASGSYDLEFQVTDDLGQTASTTLTLLVP